MDMGALPEGALFAVEERVSFFLLLSSVLHVLGFIECIMHGILHGEPTLIRLTLMICTSIYTCTAIL